MNFASLTVIFHSMDTPMHAPLLLHPKRLARRTHFGRITISYLNDKVSGLA